ncbi:AI-2E family transporter [Helicobacter muridarum]|uniref:AI-2E family transporter n=1 Tax=Helicobacter muridarum TaxID=216 RepID=A0A099TYT0_9HELI|nr:AI-2E family transporter [Helicobacter muridarum]TLE00216.1 AI-2E family transporter [Helicobacter muridarum]STQ85704.1 outer membrane protein [Helicobacter muridarum]
MQTKIFFTIIFTMCLCAIGTLYYAYIPDMIIALLLCISIFWIKAPLKKLLKYDILASLSIIVFIICFIFIPLGFILSYTVVIIRDTDWNNLPNLFYIAKEHIINVFQSIPELQERLPLEDIASYISEFSPAKISAMILKYTTALGQGSFNIILDGFVIIIFVFIFLHWGQMAYSYITKLLPFSAEQINQVSHEVSGTLRIVFLSTIFNVVLQGSAFGIITYMFGFHGVILGIIYGICSLIPIIGGVIVWLPISIILYLNGDTKEAIILVLYSAIFIGFIIDNLLKPWIIGIVNAKLLEKPLQISEFLIFFAILAGIGSFGFWGIIIGPAINALFIALLRVYERDFLFRIEK